MNGPRWRPLHDVDRRALGEARLQAHFGAQWLARAARASIAPRPGDGHTNLGWDNGCLRTHRLSDGARLALRIADLSLVVQNPAGDAPSLPLDGRGDADVRAWLGPLMQTKGLDARLLDAPSPYEMPEHVLARAGRYARMPALGALADWFANADLALGEIREGLVNRGLNAPPVRLWPHHFDLDTLVAFTTKEGEDGSMGVGFSPGDEYYDEPYFYVSLHPAPHVTMLPGLPAIGHWHTDDFTAAIATASRIVAAKGQAADTMAALRATTDIAVRALMITSDIVR